MIYKDLILALKGRREWIRIKNKYKVKDGILVLLMIDNNDNINYYALKHLDSFRRKKYMDKVLILTDKIKVSELLKKNPVDYTEVVLLESERCRALVKYYQLQEFYSGFILVSVSQPDGNTVDNMLKSNKLTEEELLLGSLYI